jgi:hypothetical protein
MNLKTIFFFSLFFQYITSFGQFKDPEPTITRPAVILPENQISDYAKSFNKKLKKSIIDKKITEYDINGNIIKEVDPGISSTTTTLYVYQNNVLVEKTLTTISNAEIVKRNNADNARRIEESQKKGEESIALVVFDDVSKKNTYKATLGKKNRVVSYISERKETGDYRPINDIKQVNITYDKDKIIEINTNNTEKKHYLYNNNLLVKVEYLTNDVLGRYYTSYCYDNNNNLIAIRDNGEGNYKGKVVQNSKVKDSAVYDNKNNLIWAYDKGPYVPMNIDQNKNFITYKYDNNNNLVESSKYENEKERMKIEYVYENKLLTKEIKTYYIGVPVKTIGSKTYNYADGKLMEYNEIDPFTNSEKQCTYEYDEAKHLKKIIEIRKWTDRKTGKITNYTTTADFSFNKNTLTFKNQIGKLEIYEFFE